jgi:hypothetical protein
MPAPHHLTRAAGMSAEHRSGLVDEVLGHEPDLQLISA